VLRFASGFFPTRPHGASAGASRRRILRAVASGSRLLSPRPAKDFHLQSSAHARHTYALPPSQALYGKDTKPGRTPLIVRGKLSRQPGPSLFIWRGAELAMVSAIIGVLKAAK
jgi:hypothetical protein